MEARRAAKQQKEVARQQKDMQQLRADMAAADINETAAAATAGRQGLVSNVKGVDMATSLSRHDDIDEEDSADYEVSDDSIEHSGDLDDDDDNNDDSD